MHLINPKTLGILILFLLASLVVIKRKTTGLILEKPKPNLLLWLVNIFNLFFLLVANPLAAILLIIGKIEDVDPTLVTINARWLLIFTETAGFIIYFTGFTLMSWALITLRSNYQLGGSDPRPNDTLIISGPYNLVRHPMYTAALCIALGLTCLIQSTVCFVAFCIYLLLIILIIPGEEAGLIKAYGESYMRYRHKVGKLLPLK